MRGEYRNNFHALSAGSFYGTESLWIHRGVLDMPVAAALEGEGFAAPDADAQ